MEKVDHHSPSPDLGGGEFVPELALSSVEDEKALKSNINGRRKKTLGGHMRIRLDSPKNPPKMNENDDSEMGDRKIQKCWLCGKSFSSLRSLCGHMRCHPAGERRGERPPEKNPSSASSSNGTEGVDEEAAYGAACGLMLLATGEERYKLSPNEEEKEEPLKSKKRRRNEVDGRRCREEEKRVVVLDVDLNEVAPA